MNTKALIASARAYFPKANVHVETDLNEIATLLESKGVTCWAQGPIPDTDAFKLAETSPRGGKKLVIICSQEDARRAEEKLPKAC
jgi:hypothetical protein